ncbi:hypothetical protein HKCCE3408_07230 [Rhodobacterales bacterium HKCCE3408]|nr:hypothetical protein [Rhodobacterales bacterium HKCCE3408]
MTATHDNPADRTMRIERVINAKPDEIWRAWTDPDLLPRWWGPDGFSCDTTRIDLREGGEWVFDMIGPDGTRYPNQHEFVAYDRPNRIEYNLNRGAGGPKHADVTVTIDDLGDGKSRLTLTMIMSDQADYNAAMSMGAERLGLQTLGKLAALVEA